MREKNLEKVSETTHPSPQLNFASILCQLACRAAPRRGRIPAETSRRNPLSALLARYERRVPSLRRPSHFAAAEDLGRSLLPPGTPRTARQQGGTPRRRVGWHRGHRGHAHKDDQRDP